MNLESEIYYRLKEISTLRPENITVKLQEFLKGVKPRKQRTSQQNKGLHVDCDLIAGKLNDAGLDIREVLRKDMDIPWTGLSVKEYIWKPTQKSLYGIVTTTKLNKHGEIEKVHDVIMRYLGEKFGIEYHDFPNDPLKKKELEEMTLGTGTDIPYPESEGEVKGF